MNNDKDTIKKLEAQLNVATKLLDERKDKWISVDDRLPETRTERSRPVSDEVLISCEFECFVGKYGYGAWMGLDDLNLSQSDITHWMPLPSPPQEAKS